MNATFAYLIGFYFGKTPLIMLSPKKTVEGFLGGAVLTLIFTYFVKISFFMFWFI